MPEDPKQAPSPNHAFTSWKEIAQHFGREVRTVQRWEKEERLPIHRHAHQRRASVYAYPEELDAWWRERGAHIAEPPAEAVPQAKPWAHRLWLAVPVVVILLAMVAWLRFSATPPAEEAPPFSVITLEGTRANSDLMGVHTGDLNGDGVGDFAVSAFAAR